VVGGTGEKGAVCGGESERRQAGTEDGGGRGGGGGESEGGWIQGANFPLFTKYYALHVNKHGAHNDGLFTSYL